MASINTIKHNGHEIVLNPNKLAKVLRLKYNPKEKIFSLTIPPKAKKTDIDLFLQKATTWLSKKRNFDKENIYITNDSEIHILGDLHNIVFEKSIRRAVIFEKNSIRVLHPFEGHSDLLEIALKEKALEFLRQQSIEYANVLGVKIEKVSVRDTVSKWGSCSSKGSLSYSWRVILAPLEVAKYLCAHEVSHLKHMNHSVNFWKTVESICPDYEKYDKWLTKNGRDLFLYRFK